MNNSATQPSLRELKQRANSSFVMRQGVNKAKPVGQIEVENEKAEDQSVSG